MTYGLMGLFLLLYITFVLKSSKYSSKKENFLDLYESTILKGLFCIIVVLVHVPETYQNRIQNMIGSFAYIGVTYFFLTSAYGIKHGMAYKDNYLKIFWKKRLPAILTPAILCNLIEVLFSVITKSKITVFSFININAWVKVIVLYYFIFWVVYCISSRIKNEKKYYKDICICLIIIIISLVDRLTPKNIYVWPAESWGFAYGIFLGMYYDRIKEWMSKKWIVKSSILWVLSIVMGLVYLKFKYIDFWGDYCLKILLGIAIIALIFTVLRKVEIKSKLLYFLGSISYEIYLIHGAIFKFVESIMDEINSGIYIWISVIITLLVAATVKYINDELLKFINNYQNI